MEDSWKVRMNICTALRSFVNFCCFSQSEVSTDNSKVSTFFAFQQVHCRCCYSSYLDRSLNTKSSLSLSKIKLKSLVFNVLFYCGEGKPGKKGNLTHNPIKSHSAAGNAKSPELYQLKVKKRNKNVCFRRV